MKLIPLLFFVLISSCATQRPEFKNKDVCFLLFNIDTGTFEQIIGKDHCEKRLPPASTFKVPLAVMGFDSGVLKDEKTMFKWDGKKRMLDVWNKDHTAMSWMHDSVVWFSQELTPKMGKEKIENYLRSFEYGTADMSGGLQYAWLTRPPVKHERRENTVKVSGFEQIHFLKNLWRGELKVSSDAQLKTKNILLSEISPKGYRFAGKTGSGTLPPDFERRVGWWIGYLETKNDNYAIAINFVDQKKEKEKSFGGPEAKEMAKKLLEEKKLW